MVRVSGHVDRTIHVIDDEGNRLASGTLAVPVFYDVPTVVDGEVVRCSVHVDKEALIRELKSL